MVDKAMNVFFVMGWNRQDKDYPGRCVWWVEAMV